MSVGVSNPLCVNVAIVPIHCKKNVICRSIDSSSGLTHTINSDCTEMAKDGPQIDFRYTWKKSTHAKAIGTLICSANALHVDSSDLEEVDHASNHTPDAKPLLIYRSEHDESKDVMDGGKTYKCPSFSGYVTSNSGSRFEVNIAFARNAGGQPAKWQNYNDELVARLYVDGNVEPIEEISESLRILSEVGFAIIAFRTDRVPGLSS